MCAKNSFHFLFHSSTQFHTLIRSGSGQFFVFISFLSRNPAWSFCPGARAPSLQSLRVLFFFLRLLSRLGGQFELSLFCFSNASNSLMRCFNSTISSRSCLFSSAKSIMQSFYPFRSFWEPFFLPIAFCRDTCTVTSAKYRNR